MRAVQIILYVGTFAVLFALGNLFDEGFRQAGIHAGEVLGGKPLPVISRFFISHHHLPAHLVLLPWLALVGIPLVTPTAAKDYWNPGSFCFRYIVFLSVEILIFIVMLLALTIPFLPHYFSSPPARQSTLELLVRIIFWSSTALVAALLIRRLRR